MKMKLCPHCKESFPIRPIINGKRKNFQKRIYCLTCSPLGTKDCRPVSMRTVKEGDMFSCTKCKTVLEVNDDNFARVWKNKERFRKQCHRCLSSRTVKAQRERKNKCLEYKGNKCSICGYSRCKRSLQFHHLEPSQKDFNIGSIRLTSWLRIQEELDKCILVCANCHGELHAGLITL